MTKIGTPQTRQDGRLKVTGAATYSAEFDVPGVTYAALVLSPVSSGRVRGFDLAAAKKAPGVLTILTHQNMPALKELNPTVGADGGAGPGEDRTPMRDDKITYNGQIIALVVADTLDHARHAANLIVADIEETKPFLDMERTVLVKTEDKAGSAGKDAGQSAAESEKKAPPPKIGTRVAPEKRGSGEEAQLQRGNPSGAMAGATHRITAQFSTPHEHHNPIEPHAIIALWKGDELTAYISCQSTKSPQRVLAHVFGLKDEQVRTVSHFIGGGFGCKGPGGWPHDIACAVAARRVGKPVKLALTRQEMFSLVGHRGQTSQHIAIGAQNNGTISALTHACLTDAHPNNGFFERPAVGTSRVMYELPNYGMGHQAAQVNIAPPIFMRAPGESPGTWALESALDEMAHEVGMDPVAFRLANHADVHPQTRKPWSSKHLKECYARGQHLIGWSGRSMMPRMTRQGRYLIGWGMATATYPGYRQAAAARVRLYPDGRAIAASSGCDIGTGAYTVFRLVAADALGYPIERVTMELGDSDLPFAPVAGGSQLTASVAPAVQEACQRAMIDVAALAIKDPASPLRGRELKDLDYGSGRVFVKGNASVGEPLSTIVRRSGKPFVEHCIRKETMSSAKGAQGLKQSQRPPCTPIRPVAEVDQDQDKYAFQSFGAQFCKVRVDEALGMIRVLDYAAVFDVGTVLNPKTARSQAIGGISYGIGMALHEETFYHPEEAKVGRAGRPVVRNLADYHVASHADVPDIQIAFINKPDPHINTLGARGLGEIGITGVAAAIGNAVFNATGTRVRDLPILPERVMKS